MLFDSPLMRRGERLVWPQWKLITKRLQEADGGRGELASVASV